MICCCILIHADFKALYKAAMRICVYAHITDEDHYRCLCFIQAVGSKYLLSGWVGNRGEGAAHYNAPHGSTLHISDKEKDFKNAPFESDRERGNNENSSPAIFELYLEAFFQLISSVNPFVVGRHKSSSLQ